jgi:DNA invertase Pin-like site-specific DNA recombinase
MSRAAADAAVSAAEACFVERPGERLVLRAGLYARVSTIGKGQATDNQLIQLREFSRNQHWVVVREYEDHESGGKTDRNEFQLMLRDAAARKFDVLLFWSLDRLTREGTLATLKYLELIESYGVHWRSLTEPWIDSAGPFRDVIISLLASLAKQERVRISERVQAGLMRAKQYGTRSGKAIGRPPAVFRRDQAIELRAQGLSWRKIGQTVGASPTTVRRVCKGPTERR